MAVKVFPPSPRLSSTSGAVQVLTRLQCEKCIFSFLKMSFNDDSGLHDDVNDKDDRAHFVAPIIQDNPDGWGPFGLLDPFKDMPYQPFSKGDRLGKVRTYVHKNN